VKVVVAARNPVKVNGRVVDRYGHPMEGVEVNSFWNVREETQKQESYEGATTNAEGRFTLKVVFYGADAALMAIDAARKVGGCTVVSVSEAKREIEIRVEPLVRVHGKLASRKLGQALAWTNVYINSLPGKIRLLQNGSYRGEFSILLPPGTYEMNAYGGDVKGIYRTISVRAGQPDLDLGTLDLPATVLALHKGKRLPPWSLADARGVRKDVTLADYRGKWVLIDFWGFWCGPCVRQIGELIDFYDDHAADRDKFEILAFHDGSVKDFSELNTKAEPARKSLWHGRDLPFPVLLDAANGARGVTVEAYEIQRFPTTILIDPDGRLVGESDLDELETKLTPIPMPVRVRRALDRNIAMGVQGCQLAPFLKGFGQMARVPIKLDEDTLEAAGIEADVLIPLTMSGSLTLRSWLELLLDPLGLEAEPGEEGIMIVPAKRGGAARAPSEIQKRCITRLNAMLGQPVTFDFKDATLEQVTAHFEATMHETFVLDPAGRRAGLIDSEATVTGSARDVPLGRALGELLKPLDLIPVVKDEVVVLTKAEAP
jgi:thiol-disulfide isomerase/thioredoxin